MRVVFSIVCLYLTSFLLGAGLGILSAELVRTYVPREWFENEARRRGEMAKKRLENNQLGCLGKVSRSFSSRLLSAYRWGCW